MSHSRAAGGGALRTTLPPDTSLSLPQFAGYERARDLPKLLPLWAWELKTPNRAEHARLVARLRRALRAERQRGLGGHWTYDLARHAQLLRAYRAEVAACLRASPAVRSPGDGETT